VLVLLWLLLVVLGRRKLQRLLLQLGFLLDQEGLVLLLLVLLLLLLLLEWDVHGHSGDDLRRAPVAFVGGVCCAEH